MSKASERIEVRPNKKGWWLCHFRAGNGQLAWNTEAYESDSDSSPEARSRHMAIIAAKKMAERLSVPVVAIPLGTPYAPEYSPRAYVAEWLPEPEMTILGRRYRINHRGKVERVTNWRG